MELLKEVKPTADKDFIIQLQLLKLKLLYKLKTLKSKKPPKRNDIKCTTFIDNGNPSFFKSKFYKSLK
jgi:hypothetical protein